MCKSMEWRHLPSAGGLYDQNPMFLERMSYLMQEEAKEEKRQEARKKRETMGPTPKNPGVPRR